MGVPNAPCGVESRFSESSESKLSIVPNAPCGVESSTITSWSSEYSQFLMHRVELKVPRFRRAYKIPLLGS